jgi:hypothetical protein
LDLSQNTALTILYCNNNQLVCLNVKNGNNLNFVPPSYGPYFCAGFNPNLWCIEVDDVAWSNLWWWSIDPQTSFSTNCGNACSTVLGINELNTNTTKTLSKIIDLTGREIQYKKNTLMIYIYEDGTSERVIEFE